MFQGPPGLSFGPNLPSPKFKEVKAKQKKVKSRAAAEKERKNTRDTLLPVVQKKSRLSQE